MVAEERLQTSKKIMIQNPWILCGAGILFCLTGAYLYHKSILEENSKHKIIRSVLLIIGGVILTGIGTARYLKTQKAAKPDKFTRSNLKTVFDMSFTQSSQGAAIDFQ